MMHRLMEALNILIIDMNIIIDERNKIFCFIQHFKVMHAY